MRKATVAICAFLAACLARPSDGHEHERDASHGASGPPREIVGTDHASCHVPVRITEDAERRPGGALYAGPPVGRHLEPGESPPEMKGAHMTHRPQHGGTFFMAANKVHHLEVLYSKECGVQLFLYNAFTEPIRVNRFRAIIKIISGDEGAPEIMRFLSPSEDGTVLGANLGDGVKKPFEIQLYVKFPETEQPDFFNIFVSDSGR